MATKLKEEAMLGHYRINVRRLQAELRRTKTELKAEKTKTNKLSMALQLKDNKYKKQQENMDKNLGSIFSKLLLLEGELRREKQVIDKTLEVKERTESWQQERISRLEGENLQLRETVKKLREATEDGKPRNVTQDHSIKSVKACLPS